MNIIALQVYYHLQKVIYKNDKHRKSNPRNY